MKTIQSQNERERQQVYKEINLHSVLNHENVIKFEDYLDGKNEMYIFIELAQNGDLFSYLAKNKSSEKDLIRFFYQTCKGIQYLHNKNIMHRDLKPENILLDENLTIKICDFGWSAEYFESIPRETLCGTFEYMAPEVLLSKRQTKKTDVWSLGILLYELFHGYAPFKGNRLEDILRQISANTLGFKKSIDVRVKELIIRILKFYPEERPTVDEILQTDFILEFINNRGIDQNQKTELPNPDPFRFESKNNCFLKSKGVKMDGFFMEETKNQDPNLTERKEPLFYNLYSERNLENGPQVFKKEIKANLPTGISKASPRSLSNLVNANQFQSNQNDEKFKVYQANRPVTSDTFFETDSKNTQQQNEETLKKNEKTAIKYIVSNPPRSPVFKTSEVSNQKFISMTSEKDISLNNPHLRAYENLHQMGNSDSGNMRKPQIISNPLMKVFSKQVVPESTKTVQRIHVNGYSSSNNLGSANVPTESSSHKYISIADSTKSASKFVNYNDLQQKSHSPSKENLLNVKQSQPQKVFLPEKNHSNAPNPIYRKIGTNEKSFTNYLTTFQKKLD